MKSKFAIILFCITSIIFLGANTSKHEAHIPDITAYAKRVFEILITQDSVAYTNEIEIKESDLKGIMTQYFLPDTAEIKKYGLTFDEKISKEITNAKKQFARQKTIFFSFNSLFKAQNIIPKDSKFLSCSFKIKNAKESENLIGASFIIMFENKGRKFTIKNRESIVLKNSWRGIELGNDLGEINKKLDTITNRAAIVDSTAIVDENNIHKFQLQNLPQHRNTNTIKK